MSLLSKLFNREDEDEQTEVDPQAKRKTETEAKATETETETKGAAATSSTQSAAGAPARGAATASPEPRQRVTTPQSRAATVATKGAARPGLPRSSRTGLESKRTDETAPYETPGSPAATTISVGAHAPPPLPKRTTKSSIRREPAEKREPTSSSRSKSKDMPTPREARPGESRTTASRTTGSRTAAAKKSDATAPKTAEMASRDSSADLDAALDAALPSDGSQPQAVSETNEADLSAAREMFLNLGGTQLRPVLDTMILLREDRASRAWLDGCAAPLKQLKTMAAELELKQVSDDIDRVLKRLDRVQKKYPEVAASERDSLLDAYRRLARAFPNAADPNKAWDERQPIIVDALLRQAVGPRTHSLGKLFGAGLNHLNVLSKATADDIASTAGVDNELARRIAGVFRSYQQDYAQPISGPNRGAELAQLRELVTALQTAHDEYCAARSSWSESALVQRKISRATRASLILQIHVLLARLGEVAQVQAISQLPFSSKLERLDSFIAATKDSPLSTARGKSA